jgi:hypothetical protein
MTDKPLFSLDAEGRWRLAYDRQQWVVQRRRRAPRRSERAGIADSGWRGVSFIGSTKATLARVLGEKGVVLTAEAAARLDALPERFVDFIAAPERFFARPEAKAA